MPELPEVETIKNDLSQKIINAKINDFQTLWPGILKDITIDDFKKNITGQKIVNVERRAKLLIIRLENNYQILFHLKMTGHLLITPADEKITKTGNWLNQSGSLKDPLNQYIRAIFWLDNNKIIAFSDLRKFGYIKLADPEKLSEILKNYGPEPFSKDFNVQYLSEKFKKKSIAIKKALMDQSIIAGIGNIYADEILFATRIHPETPACKLTPSQLSEVIEKTKLILQESIELRGTSTSDYRDTEGKKGEFMKRLKVYKQTNKNCKICQEPIERIVVGGRGTHYCPKCQVKND
jgi:formamidopyrimidine-DNA glycosylase